MHDVQYPDCYYNKSFGWFAMNFYFWKGGKSRSAGLWVTPGIQALFPVYQ